MREHTLWCVVAPAAVLWNLLVYPMHHDGFYISTLVGTVVLAAAALYDRQARPALLLLACLLNPLLQLSGQVNHALLRWTAHPIDASMLRLDHGVSVGIYHWALRNRGWKRTFSAFYHTLPLFSAVVWCVSPRRLRCAASMMLAAVFAVMFYVAFPAVGPAHVGDLWAPRNCVPSLHVTWALLLVAYSPRRVRPFAVIFAAFTCVSTLTTGEHYLIDLVAAGLYSAVLVFALEPAPRHRAAERIYVWRFDDNLSSLARWAGFVRAEGNLGDGDAAGVRH